MRTIDMLVVHCSDTPAHMDIGADEIRQWHLERGWSDIGYHYVIGRDGIVEPGRPIETPGAHVRGHNARSIGICLVGGKGGFNFTWLQLFTLRGLLASLKDLFPDAAIVGHRDLDDNKECPTFSMVQLLKGMAQKWPHSVPTWAGMAKTLNTPKQFEEILRMFEDIYELGDAYGISDFTDRAILRTICRQRIQSNCMLGHTVSSVARAVGLPVETTRRRVQALVDRGYVSRDEDGLDVPEEMREVMRGHINDVYAILIRAVTSIEKI